MKELLQIQENNTKYNKKEIDNGDAAFILTTMQAIRMLLDNPNNDSPLNVDAANILRAGDVRGYRSYIRMLLEDAKINP